MSLHPLTREVEKVKPLIVGSGTNPALCREVLSAFPSDQVEQVTTKRFSDGELDVEYASRIDRRLVYLVGSVGPPNVNANLVNMLLLASAADLAHERVAVLSYLGYSRNDYRKQGRNIPLTAKTIPMLFAAVGVHRLLVMETHAKQAPCFAPQGAALIPMQPRDCMLEVFLRDPLVMEALEEDKFVICNPDSGGAERARAYRSKVPSAKSASMDKLREGIDPTIGGMAGNVKGCLVGIFDDMIDRAGTLCEAAEFVCGQGARGVVALASHPVFSGPAVERINSSPHIKKVFVGNTLPLSEAALASDKIEVISVSSVIVGAIKKDLESLSEQ
ncbi:MAG: ribose-phosphate diphosphokinase [bacterium]